MGIEVWRQSNGFWRWAYREGEVRLPGNSEYRSARTARRSASTAYPGTPITVRDGGAPPPPRKGRLRVVMERALLAVIAYHVLRRVLGRRERLPARGRDHR